MRTALILMIVFFISVSLAGPIDTDFVEWTQPDGTRFTARLCGDEFIFTWNSR